jgi:hypothetical protein
MEGLLVSLGRVHEDDVGAERGGGLEGRLGLVGVAELQHQKSGQSPIQEINIPRI